MQFREHIVRLPSAPVGYEGLEVPLLNGEGVKVSNFTMAHKREMAGMDNSNTYLMFRHVLEQLLVEPNAKSFDLDKLLLSDCLILFYAIKYRSWGDDFVLPYVCPICSVEQESKFQISKLNIFELADRADYKATGIEIQWGDHKVVFHLPRLEDERAVFKELETMTKMKMVKNKAMDTNLLRAAQMIDKIDGKSYPLQQKFQSLLQMQEEDIQVFAEFVASCDTGIDHELKGVLCSNCGVDNSDLLVLGVSPGFFRGESRRIQKISGCNDAPSETRQPAIVANGSDDPKRSDGSI